MKLGTTAGPVAQGTIQAPRTRIRYGRSPRIRSNRFGTIPRLFQSLRLSQSDRTDRRALGVAFALGSDRWHSRPAKGFNFLMLLSLVLPEIVLGISVSSCSSTC
jgi:hypothetical protein